MYWLKGLCQPGRTEHTAVRAVAVRSAATVSRYLTQDG